MRLDGRQIDAELRGHGEYGREFQLLHGREFYAGRRFNLRAQSITHGKDIRKELEARAGASSSSSVRLRSTPRQINMKHGRHQRTSVNGHDTPEEFEIETVPPPLPAQCRHRWGIAAEGANDDGRVERHGKASNLMLSRAWARRDDDGDDEQRHRRGRCQTAGGTRVQERRKPRD